MGILYVIAGHGAGDPGAEGCGFQEAERVRALATKIKEYGGEQVVLHDFNDNAYASGALNWLDLPSDAQVVELHMDCAGEGARGAHVIYKGSFSPDDYDVNLANFIAGVFPGRASILVGRNDLANVNRAANRGIAYRLVENGFISSWEDVNIFNSRIDEIAKGYCQVFGIIPADTTPLTEPETPVEVPSGNLLTYQERAAEVMEHYAAHDASHGYSQYNRWGNGSNETLTLSDGTTVVVSAGDRDCSAGIISAWEAVLPGSTAGATYTGDMKEEFLSTGLFEWHPIGDGYIAQRGDIYLNEGNHTAMCTSAEPDMMAEFAISENYTIHGVEGDQTGWECQVVPYHNYGNGGWDGKLVYIGQQPDGSQQEEPSGDEPGGIGIQVAVDGYWGRDTTAALQTYFGTVVDGEVWHQWQANLDKNPALTYGWEADSSLAGSPVIRALQNRLGVNPDGIIGTETIIALQNRLGTYADGVLDAPSPCVKELQRRLNIWDL